MVATMMDETVCLEAGQGFDFGGWLREASLNDKVMLSVLSTVRQLIVHVYGCSHAATDDILLQRLNLNSLKLVDWAFLRRCLTSNFPDRLLVQPMLLGSTVKYAQLTAESLVPQWTVDGKRTLSKDVSDCSLPPALLAMTLFVCRNPCGQEVKLASFVVLPDATVIEEVKRQARENKLKAEERADRLYADKKVAADIASDRELPLGSLDEFTAALLSDERARTIEPANLPAILESRRRRAAEAAADMAAREAATTAPTRAASVTAESDCSRHRHRHHHHHHDSDSSENEDHSRRRKRHRRSSSRSSDDSGDENAGGDGRHDRKKHSKRRKSKKSSKESSKHRHRHSNQ
jgi:hypothetical protein